MDGFCVCWSFPQNATTYNANESRLPLVKFTVLWFGNYFMAIHGKTNKNKIRTYDKMTTT